MPPDPSRVVFVYLSYLKLTLPGKNRAWKSDEIWCSLPEKNSEYASDMKPFERAYLRPFPGLNVFVFSQHST